MILHVSFAYLDLHVCVDMDPGSGICKFVYVKHADVICSTQGKVFRMTRIGMMRRMTTGEYEKGSCC